MIFLCCALFVAVLSMVVLGAGLSLGVKLKLDREKSSPFECGFSPKLSARMPFSLRFFLISIVFLVFDVEIVLLFPAIGGLYWSSLVGPQLLTSAFVLVLVLGLYHEINQGSINWAD